MRFLISDMTQKEIILHILDARDLSLARRRYEEQALAKHFKAGTRAIKEHRREIRANNPDNPLIDALRLNTRTDMIASSKHFKKWQKEKHSFIIVPKDLDSARTQSIDSQLLKRILMAQYTAMMSGGKPFKNSDYTAAVNRLSAASSLKERSHQNYLAQSVTEELLEKTDESRPSYKIAIPYPHRYSAGNQLYQYWTKHSLHDVARSKKYEQAIRFLDFFFADNPEQPQTLAVPNMPYYFYLKSYPLGQYYSLLARLEALDARAFALMITYGGTSVTFHLLSLIFSKERNELFLIGYEEDEDGRLSERILAAGRIRRLAAKKEHGNIVRNRVSEISFIDIQLYGQKIDEMISISDEEPLDLPPFDTVVRIDPLSVNSDGTPFYGEAGRMLKNILSHRRNTASVKEDKEKGCLIYSDRIRGEDDFRRIIRAFGDSCTLLSPEYLRKKMLRTQVGVIALYDEKDYPDTSHWYNRAEEDFADGDEKSIADDERNEESEKTLLEM